MGIRVVSVIDSACHRRQRGRTAEPGRLAELRMRELLTYALARQVFITLDEPLSADATTIR